jgi:16S rRNA (cytidine1402-2'-O)-methyltransferase
MPARSPRAPSRPPRRPELPSPAAGAETQTRGCLYLVGTPLGNLGDLSPRALDVLGRVPVLAAEDTRTARHLLGCYDLPTPARLLSYREQNREAATRTLLELLHQGHDVALVTDAGMPCVSDPGDVLVAACHEAGLAVIPVPGPSAVLAALASSGISGPRFCFEGFLSRRAAHRKQHLESLAAETRTMIFFEAPSRVADTLHELAEVLGPQRAACVARELTKKFEEIRRGSLGELCAWASSTPPRGEFVFVVAGLEAGTSPHRAAPSSATNGLNSPAELLASLMAQGMSRRDAAREVAGRLGLPRKVVYGLGLESQAP